MPTPRIIPVLDVMGGQVVRAVGGRRSEYRPVESRFGDAADVIGIARGMIEATGADTIYVADLDAIKGQPTERRIGVELADGLQGVRVWCDAGIRTPADFARVPRWYKTSRWPLLGWRLRRNLFPVIGSETIAGPDAANAAGFEFAPEVVASLDLFDGRLLGDWAAWKLWDVSHEFDTSMMAAGLFWSTGATTLIVLDLRSVGTNDGPVTGPMIRDLKVTWSEMRFVTGGGVRSREDIARLGDAGADAVLVASALHDELI